jgi:hypothetical protein
VVGSGVCGGHDHRKRSMQFSSMAVSGRTNRNRAPHASAISADGGETTWVTSHHSLNFGCTGVARPSAIRKKILPSEPVSAVERNLLRNADNRSTVLRWSTATCHGSRRLRSETGPLRRPLWGDGMIEFLVDTGMKLRCLFASRTRSSWKMLPLQLLRQWESRRSGAPNVRGKGRGFRRSRQVF